MDCINPYNKHEIASKFLNSTREHWVSLPLNYDSTKSYPVMYVLDAEWRFDLIRNIEFDLAGNKKIPGHIVVGLPHVEMEYQRGIDLTFSQSRMEYDGEAVDSTWYNAKNSGGGMKYYNYLTQELLPAITRDYSTNGYNILVGHSYGGYFGGYILTFDHPFSAIQMYDPAMWYSDGEVLARIQAAEQLKPEVHVFVAFQPEPPFHRSKIEQFISHFAKVDAIDMEFKLYPNETHNSLFLFSFLEGMHRLYNIEK